MPNHSSLAQLLDATARAHPDRVAVEEPPSGVITYRDLAALSDQVRDRLSHLGVRPGDRVGICLRKSIDAVAAIFGTLKAGAAYVPVDPDAPAQRAAYILADCGVKVVVAEGSVGDAVRHELAGLGTSPSFLRLAQVGMGLGLRTSLATEALRDPAPPTETAAPAPDDLAYILYTSGSTGKPKGVTLSHRNATSFVDWCSQTFSPTAEDRFSSHAPFHFDLSILDLFVPLKHGATLVLIGAEQGKDPLGLADLIARRRISVWYSAPSILSMLVQYGKLNRHDYSCLRLLLFAGEVFPVKHLHALIATVPDARYFNLYGPTETNVCTWYEIPTPVVADRSEPYPIGRVCSHLQARVIDERGDVAAPGNEGELCIRGPGVMGGYWNLPEQTARAFWRDPAGGQWYRTGDVVVEGPDAVYAFIGRRDRMVKRRGYRIELAEVEAGLYKHPLVREAAVVAVPDDASGVRLLAFVACAGGRRPSVIELKRVSAEVLPLYMVPDQFVFRESLPKTSTAKIDYQRLVEAGAWTSL